ncbi:hypothetical protein PILCRDRAFT_93623 [Piloderma croceum F 1598]|uniref:Uncharacterized protein n=1 Tax=Piloderma croceum (strain F 1598) TaxID=765440 RepID=A0A0C3AE10_PILCF|nr:hypothetical protein PILCRDRAFT_93623 [Piloderma croceum F 1598]
MASDGPYRGEYVASCASDACGYLVCLERMYPSPGLHIQRYPIRLQAGPMPLRVQKHLAMRYMPVNPPAKRNNCDILASVPVYEPPTNGPKSVADQLLRLDAWAWPGLSQTEFTNLFAVCNLFEGHMCLRPVIDLTGDEPEEPTRASQWTVIDLTADSDEDSQ